MSNNPLNGPKFQRFQLGQRVSHINADKRGTIVKRSDENHIGVVWDYTELRQPVLVPREMLKILKE